MSGAFSLVQNATENSDFEIITPNENRTHIKRQWNHSYKKDDAVLNEWKRICLFLRRKNPLKNLKYSTCLVIYWNTTTTTSSRWERRT